ncbi:MAG: helix-turn-helix domain-containing protein [Saprospiraceae bacterium]
MTPIDLTLLPAKVRLEISKEDLEAFARLLLEQALASSPSQNSLTGTGEFMTIIEAAKFTNLAKPTLYSLASQRKIPHFKRAKRLLFRRDDLERWLLESRRLTIEEMTEAVRKSR